MSRAFRQFGAPCVGVSWGFQESRFLCGWIFIGVNSFTVNNLCFLNDLEPEWREKVASGPGVLNLESELLME